MSARMSVVFVAPTLQEEESNEEKGFLYLEIPFPESSYSCTRMRPRLRMMPRCQMRDDPFECGSTITNDHD